MIMFFFSFSLTSVHYARINKLELSHTKLPAHGGKFSPNLLCPSASLIFFRISNKSPHFSVKKYLWVLLYPLIFFLLFISFPSFFRILLNIFFYFIIYFLGSSHTVIKYSVVSSVISNGNSYINQSSHLLRLGGLWDFKVSSLERSILKRTRLLCHKIQRTNYGLSISA